MLRKLIFLAFLTIFTALIAPCIGSVVYSPVVAFEKNIDSWIFVNIRIPRVLMGLVVGSSLAVAGVVMQCIFKNPLAEPYILGVSTGAGLGALLGFVLGLFYLTPALAFVSATLTVALVYNLARIRGFFTTESLLLAGIAVNFFLYALEWLILVKTNAHMILGWLVGYLGNVEWCDVRVASLAIIPCFCSFMFSKHLNALLLGEEQAFYLGIDVKRVLKILIALATLATSTTVAFVGIIGFVGLMIPHIARGFVGEDNRFLIPASALIGATFLAWTDALARILNVPVGIITMLCGGPFFIYVMKRYAKRL
ncbi:FecCD family ABC transporter permease [Archaeoglobus profundus]|uniref:Transport system permease protein n=1 Tax=Archaeoglobus profundus (strain DSM 5631 / JCM 9629 / NBRC 100127 / Av18) TaxID=572546 RepID=D2RGE2_ARCPA|nr:iron ABC transporter permease [Archaeoglobus profundus]ADB57367.1 transport system permease protein [Archaeoglobus profundus DSM 5631]